MGLTDEQTADLSLLRTGQCVVSQDGDLKAFQVLVENEKVHEMRKGGECSKFTKEFREMNSAFFASPSSSVDMEDGMFKDSLYKAMLAVGLGQDAGILSAIKPVRPVGEWADRREWLSVYWKQICAEIWHSHGGDWRALLALRNDGADVLSGKAGAVEKYRATFPDFFRGSKMAAESPTGDVAGIAFAPFLMEGKRSVFDVVNRNYDLLKGAPDRYVKLAEAIRRALPTLEPRGVQFSMNVRSALVVEIMNRINPVLAAETLAAFKKEEK